MKDKHIFGGKALADSFVTISLPILLLNSGTLLTKLLPKYSTSALPQKYFMISFMKRRSTHEKTVKILI
jgi:hypothetical protein